jgi:hypothetical protein
MHVQEGRCDTKDPIKALIQLKKQETGIILVETGIVANCLRPFRRVIAARPARSELRCVTRCLFWSWKLGGTMDYDPAFDGL